jgi:subtilisin-like proprotein convertase family protein
MNGYGRSYRLVTPVCAALVVAVLLGLGPNMTATTAARKRVHAELIQEFSNRSPIAIPDAPQQAAASTIEVSGFETEIADVNVTLDGLTHGKSRDIDVLLVGPGGQTAVILSDIGNMNAANNVTLTLDDQAPNQVSSSAPPASGTFQPTNFDSTDGWFPPAPVSPPSGSELGVFNSTSPNGTWRLFIKDDDFNGVGTLNDGWSLRITSANGVPNATPDSFAANAGKTLNQESSVLANDRDPDDDSLRAILAGRPTKGSVQLAPDGSFTYKSSKKAKGTDSFTYLAQDPSGLSDLETVTIQIKKAKKKGKR